MLQEQYHNKCQQLAEEWFKAACADPWTPRYLCHKPVPNGDMVVAADPPQGYQVSDPRRISPDWTETQTWRFIQEVSRHLPILD